MYDKKVLSQAKKSTYYYSLFEKRKIKIEEIDTYEDLLQEYIGVNYARKKILGNLPQGKYVWIWPANKKIRDYFYEDGNVEIYQDSKYGFKYMMPEYSPESFQKLSHFIMNNFISWITAPPSMLYFFAQFNRCRICPE